jgi:hypothetical protein
LGPDIEKALDEMQTGFERQYNQFGRLKRKDINSLDNEVL